MARIALAVGGAVAGALLAPFTGGLINPYTGAEIGFTIGGILGGILFPGKLPPGPRLNDLLVSTATDGAPIPFGYGTTRVAGNIIWAPPIVEHSTTHSVKGGPRQTTFTYTASFAASFGEGPGTISRIWFDSKVVYDTSGTTAAVTAASQLSDTAAFTSTLNPPLGSQVTVTGVGSGYDGTWQVLQSGPTAFTVAISQIYTGPGFSLPTLSGINGTASIPAPTYPAPTIYFGTQTQNADPTIQAQQGTANTPAYRGLIMAVWANMPLNDFGNRIPNIRAEVTYDIFVSTPVTPGFVQEKLVGASGITGGSVAFNSPNGAGNTIIVFVSAFSSNTVPSNPGCIVSVSDTQGNTYTQVKLTGGLTAYSYFTGTQHGFNSCVFIASNVKAGANTVIVSVLNTNTVLSTHLQIAEYTGNGIVSPLVASADFFQTGAPYTDPVPLTLTFTQVGQLAVVFTHFGNVLQPMGTINRDTGYWDYTAAATGAVQFGQALANNNAAFLWGIVLSNAPLPPNGTPYTLPQIVQDICLRSGLTVGQVDVTQLAALATPQGYIITRPSTAQADLVPLCMAYFFDGVETNGTIKFVPRGGAALSLAVPETDLGLWKDNYKVVEQLGQIQDLPLEIQVLYNDKALDYQQNKTHKVRHRRIVKVKNQTVYELPLTIDSTTARQIAEKALFLAYLERHPYDLNLWKALYLLYDPTDVINFTYEGLQFTMRITKASIGVDFSTQFSGVNENSANYTSIVAGTSGSGVTPAKGKTLPNSQLFMFDIPLLRDSDANPSGSGYYFALGTLDVIHWPGGVLEKSVDNVNFSQVDQSATAVSYGYAPVALPAPRSPWVWDTVNTLTVFMTNGVLTGTTDLNVLNGANALIYGNEVIQFVNSVQNADGSFTLSRLLRGRRGTEINCGAHGPAELVIYLNNPGIVRHQITSGDLQVLRYYEGLTYGQAIGSVPSTLFTDSGNDLRPYAVTSVAGSRDGSGNLTVTWIRRTRIGGDWLELIGTVPLSELTESYDVDVMGGPGSLQVIRTFSALASPALAYTAAQQVTDFGSLRTAVTLNIYQNSGLIGRGFKKSVTL